LSKTALFPLSRLSKSNPKPSAILVDELGAGFQNAESLAIASVLCPASHAAERTICDFFSFANF
jgi:hypothetical protein